MGGNFSVCTNTWWEGVKKAEPKSLQWYPVNEQEARGTNRNKTKNNLSKHNKLFFVNSEGSQIPAHVFQQGYGVSIPGDTQNPAGHSPEPACCEQDNE